MDCGAEEFLIAALARELHGLSHVAVGVLFPIPAAAAILAHLRSGGATRVSIVGASAPEYRLDGGVSLFDVAGQGRLDAFFLSGGQIDGEANINLVGVGDYPAMAVRWGGCFGSAYLYFVVPRVILFREEHSPRTLVPKVDFISAPGWSPPGVHRPGGPTALMTGRCLFRFDRARRRFRLESVHPGHSVEAVRKATGFDFDCPDDVPETPAPDAATLALIRGPVAEAVADPYPAFAAKVLGRAAATSA